MKKFTFECNCGWKGSKRVAPGSTKTICPKCEGVAYKTLSKSFSSSFTSLANGNAEPQQSGAATLDSSLHEAVRASSEVGWRNAGQRRKVKQGLMYDFDADASQIARLPYLKGKEVGYVVMSKDLAQKKATQKDELQVALGSPNNGSKLPSSIDDLDK
jgi:hypothetical protein